MHTAILLGALCAMVWLMHHLLLRLWRRRGDWARVPERAARWPAVTRLGQWLAVRCPGANRWLRARCDPHRFSGLPLIALTALALHLLGIGGDLIEELYEDSELQRLDERLHAALSVLRPSAFVTLFAWLTRFADPQALIAVGLVATALLLARREQALLTGLVLCVTGSQLATLLGKYVIQRPRPEVVTVYEAVTPSFPSGHTTGALAVYGFVAFCVVRLTASARLRFEVVFAAGTLVGLVALSRLVIGVHYVSDVAAGLVNGAFWLVAGIAVAEWRRERDGSG